jgi:hypothetical protein
VGAGTSLTSGVGLYPAGLAPAGSPGMFRHSIEYTRSPFEVLPVSSQTGSWSKSSVLMKVRSGDGSHYIAVPLAHGWQNSERSRRRVTRAAGFCVLMVPRLLRRLPPLMRNNASLRALIRNGKRSPAMDKAPVRAWRSADCRWAPARGRSRSCRPGTGRGWPESSPSRNPVRGRSSRCAEIGF